MLIAGLEGFLVVWIAMLVIVYGLSGRFIGLTLFFATTATLYVLLPYYFFPNDADLFDVLLATVVLGVLGFHTGLTGFSGFSERALFTLPPTIDVDQIGRVAIILLTFSLAILFTIRPHFFVEVGTYPGRIEFQARHGPLVFLLNQAVVCAAILTICAYRRRWILLALAISAGQITWAIYSSEKLSLLSASAAWLSILLLATWRHRVGRKFTLIFIGIVLPSSLLVMVFYSVLRAGITDLPAAIDIFVANLGRLGVGGMDVGDFSGPYWVFTQHLRDHFLDLTLGSTYVEQFLVFVPRVLRGEFLDLTDAFAKKIYGAAYLPGLGFGFSPWAEGYMNFRIFGFFIEGLLFGLFTRALLRSSVRLIGLNEVTIFFQIILITLFERNHFVGQIKTTIVYCIPFLLTYFVVDSLTRRITVESRTTSGIGKIGAAFGRTSETVAPQRMHSP